MAPRDAPHFKVDTSEEGTCVVVSVRGELDIATAAALRDALLRLLHDEDVPDLVVDTSGLSFVDSSGLAVLLMASRRWGEAGKRIVLRDPSPTVVRLVDLTGVRRAFEMP